MLAGLREALGRVLGTQPEVANSLSLLCEAFSVESLEEVQDVITSLLLSEVVYKAAEGAPAAAAHALHDLRAQFPPGLAPLAAVQFCRRSADHRYMLARSSTAIYICFMGTKHARDVLTDVNLLTRMLWAAEAGSSGSTGSSMPTAAAAAAAAAEAAAEAAAAAGVGAAPQATGAAGAASAPAVHRGFLGRAQGVPVEALYVHAQRQGLRLVLCGHSLGGAVAQLCTLRLLHTLRGRAAAAPPLPPLPPPPPFTAFLRCIVFGAPAIGNAALADLVQQRGWDGHFRSIALPEDPVPRLLLPAFAQRQQQQARQLPAAAAAADARQEAAVQALEQLDRQTNSHLQQEQQESTTTAAAAAAAAAAATLATSGVPAAQGGGGPPAGSALGSPPEIATPAASSSRWPAAIAGLPAAGTARALAAAAGAAAAAARTARAGAGMLLLPPLLPAFQHIGQQHHLLPHGMGAISSIMPAAATAPVPAAAAAAAAAAPVPAMPVPAAAAAAAAAPVPTAVAAGAAAAAAPGPAAAAAAAVAGFDAMPAPASAGGPPWAPGQQQQQQQRQVLQQLLGLHSMQHYRSRAAALCWQALKQQEQQQEQQKLKGHQGGPGSQPAPAVAPAAAAAAAVEASERSDPSIELSHSLAPALAVRLAVARLPVLPPPPPPPAQRQQQSPLSPPLPPPPPQRQRLEVRLVVEVCGSGLECCTGARLRLPGDPAAPPLPAAAVTNLARQQSLLGLQAASGPGSRAHSTSDSVTAGWLQAVGRKVRMAATHRRGGGGMGGQQQQQQQPGLLLHFVVPAAAILQLQLQQPVHQHQQQRQQQRVGLLPEATLLLLSDFEKQSAQVRLRPQAVWLLGLDSPLTAAVFQQLKAAAALAVAPPEQQQQAQQQWLRLASLPAGLPGRVAAPFRGLAAAAGSGAAAAGSRLTGAFPWGRSIGGGSDSGRSISNVPAESALPALDAGQQQEKQQQQQQQGEKQQEQQEQQQGQTVGRLRLRQQVAAPAARRLSRLRQQVAGRVKLLAAAAGQQQGQGQQQEEVLAALLRGMLLLDATPVLAGSSGAQPLGRIRGSSSSRDGSGGSGSNSASAVQQLELAADLLRWRQQQRQPQHARAAGNRTASVAAAASVDAAESMDDDLEDEDLFQIRQPGLAARLRREVAQAGATARRRALLLHRRRLAQRRGALRALPPPDTVLLVLHHRQLLSRSYGEGLDTAVLQAVRQVAAACRSCGGVPLLLAVASPTPLTTPFRQQLAYSTGLSDSGSSGGSSRWGTVVPLLVRRQAAPGGSWEAPPGPGSGDGTGTLQVGPLQAALHSYGAAHYQQQQQQEQQQQEQGGLMQSVPTHGRRSCLRSRL